MSKLDRCDQVVGSGDTVIAAGAYKDAEDNTRYKFGLCVNLPSQADMGDELNGKIYNLGQHRAMSVQAAGTFNKANDYGSLDEAEAFVNQFSSVDGWAKAFEKAKREGVTKADTTETLAIKILAKVLRDKAKAEDLPDDLGEAPKTEKGNINFTAWAKNLKTADHRWYEVALKKAQATDKGFS